MLTEEFDYLLPEGLIAQTPTLKRDGSKLMVINRENNRIDNCVFSDISNYLDENTVLVLNNTKVFNARLFGKKQTGATIEIFLLENIKESRWKCLAKPAKRLRPGDSIIFSDDVSAVVVEKTDFVILDFSFTGNFYTCLESIGTVPIPPYIQSENPNCLSERYQTVYSKFTGSVAAPTAGLHFSTDLLHSLQQKGVALEYLTLHVGYGTFKPMDCDNIYEHNMHYETYTIDDSLVQNIQQYKKQNKRIIAIGTTTARALESAFLNPNQPKTGTHQTNLFIAPGFTFNCIDGLVTNFHLPKSSLLVLVSAFSGLKLIKNAYNQAITQKYRFYSFGDAMLIL